MAGADSGKPDEPEDIGPYIRSLGRSESSNRINRSHKNYRSRSPSRSRARTRAPALPGQSETFALSMSAHATGYDHRSSSRGIPRHDNYRGRGGRGGGHQSYSRTFQGRQDEEENINRRPFAHRSSDRPRRHSRSRSPRRKDSEVYRERRPSVEPYPRHGQANHRLISPRHDLEAHERPVWNDRKENDSPQERRAPPPVRGRARSVTPVLDKHQIPLAREDDECTHMKVFFKSQGGWPRFSSLLTQEDAIDSFLGPNSITLTREFEKHFPRFWFRKYRVQEGLLIWVEMPRFLKKPGYALSFIDREMLEIAGMLLRVYSKLPAAKLPDLNDFVRDYFKGVYDDHY